MIALITYLRTKSALSNGTGHFESKDYQLKKVGAVGAVIS
jgi:hypothetical protein